MQVKELSNTYLKGKLLLFKKVSIIGLGYIGLPTAAILANRGIEVIGIDTNREVVETINQGKIHIVEPDLESIVHSAVSCGRLKATDRPEKADAFLIAVPTPLTKERKPDLSYIEAAAKTIGPVLQKNNLIILESTSPVGTSEKLKKWLPKLDFHIAYCPERVLPGQILKEIVENDRIIGGLTQLCAERAKTLYQTFVKGKCYLTDARTAEMTKLTENAFRDVNIAFANELSIIAEKLKIDVWELIQLANRHPRVNILKPGPGVGGHCIAIDPWFIVDSAPTATPLIRTARLVNDNKPHHVLQKAKEKIKDLDNPTVACLGLSFKANVDDLRESPSVQIVKELSREKIDKLLVVEPHLKILPKELLDISVEQVDLKEALKRADLLLLLVNHSYFQKIDPSFLKDKHIIDTRGVWT